MTRLVEFCRRLRVLVIAPAAVSCSPQSYVQALDRRKVVCALFGWNPLSNIA